MNNYLLQAIMRNEFQDPFLNLKQKLYAAVILDGLYYTVI